MLSCFARGVLTILGTLIRGDRLVVGRFLPEPWPSTAPPHKKRNTKIKAQQAA